MTLELGNNLKLLYNIEDESVRDLERYTPRATYLVEFRDSKGNLLLHGFTTAFSKNEAQRRAPSASITKFSDKAIHSDCQVYYVI